MPKKFLSHEESLVLLSKAFYGRLATSGADSQPYITPVNFVVDGNNIFFHCGIKGKKLDNIAWNPKVCFETSEPIKVCVAPEACNYSCRYWSVLVFGKAEVVEQPEIKAKAIELLIKKYAGEGNCRMPGADDLKRVNIVKIGIENITGKMNVDPD